MVAWVQNLAHTGVSATPGTIISTLTVPFANTFTTGHGAGGEVDVVLSAGASFTGISLAVQDNQGNTWTTGLSGQDTNIIGFNFGVASVPGTPPTSVNLNFTVVGGVAGNWDAFIIIDEVSAAAAVDGFAFARSVGVTTAHSGNFTTTNADLILGTVMPSSGVATAGTNAAFVLGLNDTGGGYFSEWFVQAGAGTIETTFGISSTGGGQFCSLVAFTPAVVDLLLGQISL